MIVVEFWFERVVVPEFVKRFAENLVLLGKTLSGEEHQGATVL